MERTIIVFNVQRAGPTDADLAHLARNQCRMRADAAAGRKNALGGDHSPQVFGRSLHANKQNLFAALRAVDRAFRIEVDASGSSTGSGRKAARDHFSSL